MSGRKLHYWGDPDAQRVLTCQRPGCGVQSKPSVGPCRAFGWRRGPGEEWGVGMLPCVEDEAPTE